MTAYLADTETTGVEDPAIIELAYMVIHAPTATDVEWANGPASLFRFTPPKPIQFGAMNVHHILPEDLIGCPPSSEARLPSDARFIIGHNIDFDWKALGSPPMKRICTLALSRYLWPENDSHSLGAMFYYLFGATHETRMSLKAAHSADADVENNLRLLNQIIQKIGVTTLDDLWTASERARIPVVMTFGKHKGKRIEEVDRGYVSWYLKQPDTDPYLLKAFENAGLLTPSRRS